MQKATAAPKEPNAQVRMLWPDRWGHNCPDPNAIIAPIAGGEARKGSELKHSNSCLKARWRIYICIYIYI